jgi:hypothetical protein
MKRFSIPVAALAAGLLLWGCSDTIAPDAQLAPLDLQQVIYDADDPELIIDVGQGQTICADLGDGTGESGASGKIEGEWDDGDEELTITAPEGYLIYMYCVKAGTDAVIEEVDPPLASVTVDHPDVNSVSHYVAFYMEDPTSDGEWCSPGYWRNHLDDAAVAAENLTPPGTLDDKYSEHFDYPPPRTRQGIRENAPVDPTLLQVLENPSWYGGDAFNNVGDLLSDAHPDVEFEGTRVEDSCPLSGDNTTRDR